MKKSMWIAEIGIDIDEQKETERSADMFSELKIRKEQVPLKPLLKGKFPEKDEVPIAQEVKQLSKEEAPGMGGKIGGRAAATSAPSAAAIAKLPAGIDLPKDKGNVIGYAEKQAKRNN